MQVVGSLRRSWNAPLIPIPHHVAQLLAWLGPPLSYERSPCATPRKSTQTRSFRPLTSSPP
jgi:hypothetical protein